MEEFSRSILCRHKGILVCLVGICLLPGCANEEKNAASSAPLPLAVQDAPAKCPFLYRDEVFPISFEMACGYRKEVSFENPSSPPSTIKRRVVFRGEGGGEIVMDVWENPSHMDLREWLDRYGSVARFRSEPIKEVKAMITGKTLGIREVAMSQRSPRKDYIIVGDRYLVVRLMFVDLDKKASQTAYENAIRTLSIGEVGQ